MDLWTSAWLLSASILAFFVLWDAYPRTTGRSSPVVVDEVLDAAALMDSAADAILLQTNTVSGVIEFPREVNAREFSLQLDKNCRIRMRLNLKSYETFFHLTGEYVSPRYAYLALSHKEVYDLLEPVSKEFTKGLYRYESFMIGSLHFSFIKLQRFDKPRLRIARNYATQADKRITLKQICLESAWSLQIFNRYYFALEEAFFKFYSKCTSLLADRECPLVVMVRYTKRESWSPIAPIAAILIWPSFWFGCVAKTCAESTEEQRSERLDPDL